MLRLAVRSLGGVQVDLDGEVVLAPRRASASVTSKVWGSEVALGVAEVGAVEPHVALVEEPVEGQPARRPSAGPMASKRRR